MPSVIRNILFCGCLRKNKKESTKVVENVAFDTVQKNKQVEKNIRVKNQLCPIVNFSKFKPNSIPLKYNYDVILIKNAPNLF